MYIDGVGVLLPEITQLEEFDKALSEPLRAHGWQVQDQLKLTTKPKNRRIDKYIRMALYCAEQAMENEDKTRMDTYEFSAVINSIYGPEDSVMEFQEGMQREQYEYCSPVTFSNSVFNSALGNICLNYGLKGHSVALVNSNYLEYVYRLIRNKKAQRCVFVGVENINPKKEQLERESGKLLSEGSVAFVVGSEPTEHSCARLLAVHSFFFPQFTEKESMTVTGEIERTLAKQHISKDEIDVVLGFAQGEQCLIDRQVLTQLHLNHKVLLEPKMMFQNTMGAAMGINLLCGIRYLCKNEERIALGMEYDMVGLFTYYLVERIPV